MNGYFNENRIVNDGLMKTARDKLPTEIVDLEKIE